MKKLLLFFCCLFGLFSCASQQQNTSNIDKTSNTSEAKVYLDVRTQEEWNAGHIKDALHVTLSDIQNGKNLDKIPKDTPVYVYCRSGNRSGQAIKILQEQGFNNLINAGGINSLKGVEIVK